MKKLVEIPEGAIREADPAAVRPPTYSDHLLESLRTRGPATMKKMTERADGRPPATVQNAMRLLVTGTGRAVREKCPLCESADIYMFGGAQRDAFERTYAGIAPLSSLIRYAPGMDGTAAGPAAAKKGRKRRRKQG